AAGRPGCIFRNGRFREVIVKLACILPSMSALPCSHHWTATAGFVVTQDFFTHCLAAKTDG
ncbi:MAG: hypothetical protein WBC92_03670, partial [Terracidiphilus sp.]